jgi:6-phosphofructokinase 1
MFIGLEGGKIQFTDMEEYPRLEDWEFGRPKTQWWMDIRPLVRLLAQPGPGKWK